MLTMAQQIVMEMFAVTTSTIGTIAVDCKIALWSGMAVHVMKSSLVVQLTALVKTVPARAWSICMVLIVWGALAKATTVKAVLTLTTEQQTLLDGLAVSIPCPSVVPVMMVTLMLGPCAAHVVEGLNWAVWNLKSVDIEK